MRHDKVKISVRWSPIPARNYQCCVWLYFRVCLSYRDVEQIMADRGVVVIYEAVRGWCHKFGRVYAKRLKAGRRVLSS